MTATIGRIKPHVFRGIDQDPNATPPVEPSMGAQGHPQHSDLYLNTASPSNVLLWVYAFPPQAASGVWSLVGALGGIEEVSVGSGKPTDPNTEIWYNTATGELMVNVNGVWTTAVTQAPAPEEVIIAPSDPHPKNPDTELWYDTSSRPGTLKAWVTNVWEPIGGAATAPDTDEVLVTPTQPTDADADIWYDTTKRPGELKVKLPSGEWVEATNDEVHVGPSATDPYTLDPDATAQLWYSTDGKQLFARINGKGGYWQPVIQLSPDEVFIGSSDPSSFSLGVELWFDISTTPGVLKARVSDTWVPITSDSTPTPAPDEVLVSPDVPRDQATELWVDTTTDPPLLKAQMPDGSWVVVGAIPPAPLDEVHVGSTPPRDQTTQLWYDIDDKVLRVQLPDGTWVDVTDPNGTSPAENEVWVGSTPPLDSVPFELWVDLNFAPPILKVKMPIGSWEPVGSGDSEVSIAPVDPYITNPSTAVDELWLDVSVDPHILYGRVNGSWVPITSPAPDAPDEVLISPVQPRDVNTELWVDNSTDPAVIKYNDPALGWTPIGGEDEVHVGPTASDPYRTDPAATAQLFFDTDIQQLMVRIPTPAPGHWQPTDQIPPNEVSIGVTTPLPDAELWFNTSLQPPVLMAKVNGVWVPVSADAEPPLDEVWVEATSPDPAGTYEIWYDTSTLPGVLKIKRPIGEWEVVGSDEVHVGPAATDPYVTNPTSATAQLWYATDAEQLYVRIPIPKPGFWKSIETLVPDEVHTGPSQPMDRLTQLWYDTTDDPGTLMAKNEAGDWQPVGGASEVEVTQVDPYQSDPASTAELWFDPGMNTLWARVNNQWIDAAPDAPNEFVAQVSEPNNPDVELWLDLSQNPAILMAKVNQVWQPIQVPDGTPPQPLNEVHIGPSQPKNIETELWYDTTSDPGVLKANVEGVWTEIAAGSEVEINNIDPYLTDPGSSAELWFNPSMGELSARVNNQWLPVGEQINEFTVQGSQPTNPDVEMWFDISTDPGVLKVKVNQQWVPVSQPVEPPLDEVWVGRESPDPAGSYEVWYDTNTEPGVLKIKREIGNWEEVANASEVTVGYTDPRVIDPAAVDELWYDTSKGVPGVLKAWVNDRWVDVVNYGGIAYEQQYGQDVRVGTQNAAARADHSHGTPPEEVVISDNDPLSTKPDTEFWLDTSHDPYVLKANIGGAWVQITGGVEEPPFDEVWIGAESPNPVTSTYEMWVDITTIPATLNYKSQIGAWTPIGSSSEVHVGPVDPYDVRLNATEELWYDTARKILFARDAVAKNWLPISDPAAGEVVVQDNEPLVPGVELWYDTDAVATAKTTTVPMSDFAALAAEVAQLRARIETLEGSRA